MRNAHLERFRIAVAYFGALNSSFEEPCQCRSSAYGAIGRSRAIELLWDNGNAEFPTTLSLTKGEQGGVDCGMLHAFIELHRQKAYEQDG